MQSRAGVARSGSRGRAGVIVGLVVLVLVAWVQLPGAAAADEPPTYSGAVPLTPPGLGTIFGGYVLGTFRDGRLATGQEDFEGLAADDPFYVEPSISQDVKPGTLLKAKRFDVLFAGVKPAHVAAYKIMYVTENVRGRKVISTGVIAVGLGASLYVIASAAAKPNPTHALIDLRNLHHNTGDGLHLASLAGTWTALVAGFGGLRDDEQVLALDPQLPCGINRLRFRLCWRNFRVTVDADHDRVTYTLRDGPHSTLTIRHAGEPLEISTDAPTSVEVCEREPLLPTPKQPPGREPFRRSRARSDL